MSKVFDAFSAGTSLKDAVFWPDMRYREHSDAIPERSSTSEYTVTQWTASSSKALLAVAIPLCSE